jgi:DNA-binding response OmpR family regulator
MTGKLFLIHWNQAEAETHAQHLRDEGWQVELEFEDGARAGKAIKRAPPDAVVIYLTRLPSHGRQTTQYLAETKSTRQLPIVFVGGQGEALQKTKAKLPEAIYTSPEKLSAVLGQFTKME